MAACGSSPQAQCIVGFVLSASNGLVINSESLLGEVGREFPGLKRRDKFKVLFPAGGAALQISIDGVKERRSEGVKE